MIGIPSVVEPNFEKLELETLQKAIGKMKNHMTHQEAQCWQEFFNNPHKYSTKRNTWQISRLNAVHRNIEIPRAINLNTEIQNDIELERNRPKVTLKYLKQDPFLVILTFYVFKM